MSAKAHHIRIGIFVIAGVLLLFAGLLAFGAKSYFVKKSTFETAIAGEVSGLSIGSKVLFRGVPVGKVSRIDFAVNLYPPATSDVIVVELEVEQQIFVQVQSAAEKEKRLHGEVEKGLRAMVKGQGITGTSILAVEYLNPRENPPPPIDYKPRHPYIPSAPGQFTRMLESIERSLQNIQKVDLAGIGVGVSNTLAGARDFLKKLSDLDLEATVGKGQDVLDEAKSALENVDATIKSLNLQTLSRDANELVVGLKETNSKLQATLDNARTVLEHIGTVPMEATVEDIRAALQNLNDVLAELKDYPSGFIFGKPPLPAKSVKPPSK